MHRYLLYCYQLECNPTCLACVNGTSIGCLNCTGSKLFYQGQCLDQCPIGTFQNGTTCVKCNPPCSSCANLVQCLTCVSKTYLIVSQAQCVVWDQCPGATYGDDTLGICAKCHISCTKCIGPSSSSCLACNRSLGYAEKSSPGAGPCQKMVCSQGEYLFINASGGPAQCRQCQNSLCETCSSDNPTRCTKCKKQYLEFLSEDIQCKTCNDFVGLKKGSGSTCDGL